MSLQNTHPIIRYSRALHSSSNVLSVKGAKGMAKYFLGGRNIHKGGNKGQHLVLIDVTKTKINIDAFISWPRRNKPNLACLHFFSAEEALSAVTALVGEISEQKVWVEQGVMCSQKEI